MIKRRAVSLAVASLATTVLLLPVQPAVADSAPSYMAPGVCAVWASPPRRVGNYVVGWGENLCGYPSSVATTEAGIQVKRCAVFGVLCYWSTAQNLHGPVISPPGTDNEWVAAGMKWAGVHTYRIYVYGTCFNCRSPQGGQYGPEVKLR